MFELLCIVAPGAICYVTSCLLSKNESRNLLEGICEIILYCGLIVAVELLVLMPMEKIHIINEYGRVALVFGRVSYLVSLMLGIVFGVCFAFLKKYLKISVQIKQNSESK